MIDVITPCRAPGRWKLVRKNRLTGQVVTQLENLFYDELYAIYMELTGRPGLCK